MSLCPLVLYDTSTHWSSLVRARHATGSYVRGLDVDTYRRVLPSDGASGYKQLCAKSRMQQRHRTPAVMRRLNHVLTWAATATPSESFNQDKPAVVSADGEDVEDSLLVSRSLPCFQMLQADEDPEAQPVKKKLSKLECIRQQRYAERYLVISHRWAERSEPDREGGQLKAIKEYLHEHPEVEWVWFE